MSNETATFLLINLDRSPERLSSSADLLNTSGVTYTRIQGVDGANLSLARIKSLLAPTFSQYYKAITAGEIGCYLSHIRCWQYIVENKLPYAVILEDDFSVEDDLASLNRYINAIKQPWDCIKLMEHPQKRHTIDSVPCLDKTLVRYDKVPSRTTAYVMSYSGASKMLAQSSSIGRPVDLDFQHWWESQLMVYGLQPYPFGVRNVEESTIDSLRNRKKTQKSVIKQCVHALKFKLENRKQLKSIDPLIK